MALLHSAVRTTKSVQTTRSNRLIPLVAATGDLLLLAVATLAAMVGRQRLTFFDPRDDVVDFVSVVALPLLVGWLAVLLAVGGYARDIFGASTEEYKRVVKASLLSAGLVGIGCYLTGFPLSRGFFMLVFLIGTPLLVLGRLVLRRFIQRSREHGHFQEAVIIAGDPQHIDEVAAVLRRESWLGYTVLGALSTPGPEIVETPTGIPVFGTPCDAPAVIRETAADVILFTDGAFGSARDLRRAMWDLENVSVHAIVVPSLTDVSSERLKVRPVAGLPLVHLESPRARDASRWAKRIFDVIGAAGLLVLTVPLTLATALAIKLHDGGPILFRQTRVGRDERPFACLKFRTMVVDAELQLTRLEERHERSTVLFKLAHDPRVTRPGRLLRRFSVDELPQLWNVLRGQMSLVGPRPPLPQEVARYETDMVRRLRVRPGMTGLWQVSGRSDLSWNDTVRLDLYYVDNWSMVQDLMILFRTVSAVLGSRGAY
jgi:exopolysaccharide biosynthesis polyprenyl glycosylphosphotransferase